MKEIYSSHHMWKIFEQSFLPDMQKLAESDKISEEQMENYVLNEMMTILNSFFSSPFSDQSTVLSQRQIIFIQLMQKVYKLSQLKLLSNTQKCSVESCLKILIEVAKSRSIAIPIDLETAVVSMFSKTALLSRQTSKWLLNSKQQKMEKAQNQPTWDRSIIEGLQDIVSLLEDQLKPLVEAEQSLLVDILYR